MKTFTLKRMAIAISLIAATALAACTNPETEMRQEPEILKTAETADGKISLHRALDNLHQVLEIIDGGETRASGRLIRDIETLTFEEFAPATRSTDGNTGDLVYVVNFENNEGYAILGADYRIAPVVAVTEKGSISKQELKWNREPIDAGQATDFDPNEEPDPKQSEYYCAEDDDFYLGTNDAEDENANDSSFANDLVRSYLNRSPIRWKPGGDENQEIDGATDGGTVYYDTIEVKINAKLKTKWGQNEPFNNNVHEYEPGKRRPVGCTVIAAVQIFAYTKIPKMSNFNLGDTVSWRRLESYKYGDNIRYSKTSDTIAIATICKHMADNFPIHYNYYGSKGSFATPTRVCKYMKKVGYEDAEIHRYYSKKNIISMLTKNKPIFMGAFDINTLNGHAWVIDGMIADKQQEYCGSNLVKTEIIGLPLFHCNWGWGGDCDGYYTSEIFFTGKDHKPEIFDDVDDQSSFNKEEGFGDSSKARYHYRHITY